MSAPMFCPISSTMDWVWTRSTDATPILASHCFLVLWCVQTQVVPQARRCLMRLQRRVPWWTGCQGARRCEAPGSSALTAKDGALLRARGAVAVLGHAQIGET